MHLALGSVPWTTGEEKLGTKAEGTCIHVRPGEVACDAAADAGAGVGNGTGFTMELAGCRDGDGRLGLERWERPPF